YTPSETSIENSVLILVSPSSSSLPLVKTAVSSHLNFHNRSPRPPSAPTRPTPERWGVLAVGGAAASSASILALICAYCRDSFGNSSSAPRHAESSDSRRPALACAAASEDSSRKRSACTRR